MATAKRILLHIGLFKTGTKSIQRFLRERVGAPSFPLGVRIPNVHIELSLYCLRTSALEELCRSGLSHRWLGYNAADRPSLRQDVPRLVRAQVDSEVPTIIYSNETLSWVRQASELDDLFDLFSGRHVDVVMYRRNPAEFLASYSMTMCLLGFANSGDRDSIANVREDSWLLDFDHRVALWSRRAASVTVIDYDDEVARTGSVIPSFAALVGVEASTEYRENVTAEWLRRL